MIAPRGCCGEGCHSGGWPAICCCWTFLVRTRDRIANIMFVRCCNGRLRRGHRSPGFRPCLVRMAVGAPACRVACECPGGTPNAEAKLQVTPIFNDLFTIQAQGLSNLNAFLEVRK